MSDRCCVRVGTDSRTSVALLTSESSRTKAVVDKESERKGRKIQGGGRRGRSSGMSVCMSVSACVCESVCLCVCMRMMDGQQVQCKGSVWGCADRCQHTRCLPHAPLSPPPRPYVKRSGHRPSPKVSERENVCECVCLCVSVCLCE